MPSLFSLFVDLKANTADFVSGMSTASYAAKKAGRDIEDSFSSLGGLAEKALAPLGEVGEAIGSALARTAEAAGNAGSKLATLSSISIASAFASIATASVAGAAALATLAIKGAEAVESLERISEKTGISISQLQVLGAAGQSVGVSLDDVATGLRKFDEVLAGDSTVRGASALQNVLKSLGVTAKDNQGALLQLADAFHDMPDGPRKSAIAVELLGRSGLNLIPVLNKGRDGILEFQATIDEFGPSITSRAITATEDWKKSTLDLSESWKSVEVELTKGVLPVVSWLTEKIAVAVKAYSELPSKLKDIALYAPGQEPQGVDLTGKEPLGKQGIDQGAIANSIATSRAAAAMTEVDQQKSSYKDLYQLLAAGGAKQLELQKQEENLSEAVAVQDYKQAIAIETKIKALQSEIALEKQKPKNADSKDDVAELTSKLAQQSAEQLRLAGSIEQSVGAMTLAKAAGEADLKIFDERSEKTAKLTSLTGELQNAQRSGDTAEATKLKTEITDVRGYLEELDTDVPLIRQRFQEIAASKLFASTSEELGKEGEKYDTQIASLHELVEAYKQGGSAIASVGISQQLEGAREKVKDLADTEAQFAAANPFDFSAIQTYANAVVKADAELRKLTGDASAKQMEELTLEIEKQSLSLKGEAASYAIVGAAAFSSAAAQREAAAQAAVAKFSVEHPEADSTQKQGVYDNALGQQRLQFEQTIQQIAQQHDLNYEHDQEIEKLNAAKEVLQGYGQSTLAIQAAIYDANQKSIEQWDQVALKIGSVSDKFQAFANQIQLEGQDFGDKVFSSMSKAVDDVSTQLAKFVVTGKSNFKQLFQSLEESVAKAGFQKLFASIASPLAGVPAGNLQGKTVGSTSVVGSLFNGGALNPNAPGGTHGTFQGPLGFLNTLFGKNQSGQKNSGKLLGAGPDGSAANPFYTIPVDAQAKLAGKTDGSTSIGSSLSDIASNPASASPVTDFLKAAGANTGFPNLAAPGSADLAEAGPVTDFLNATGSNTGIPNLAPPSSSSSSASSAVTSGLSSITGSIGSAIGGTTGALVSGLGKIVSPILGLFGGFLAGGGDVTPGKAYVVGEKHPEFFVPGARGTVAPSLKAQQQGHTFNTTVVVQGAKDADSFQRSRQQISAMMHREITRAAQRT